jgi:hypothetical protein
VTQCRTSGGGIMPDYQRDPVGYALALVEEGLISYQYLAEALLTYMSHDDVREALDANELSPRFLDSDEDEEG